MEDFNPDLIFDLSCLQGQIADLGIGLQGLETQRLLNNSLYTETGANDDTQKFIHDLTDFLKLIQSGNNNITQGLCTFYISEFLYNAMLTLNKFVNEVEYNSNFIMMSTEGVRPFNKTFSQNLYRLIKKGKLISTKRVGSDDPPNITFTTDVTNSFKFITRDDLLDQTKFIEIDEMSGKFKKPIEESVFTDSYQVVIPQTFLTSENDFGNNMRKLIADLYREYYYYELVDIQKRLNLNGNAATILDSRLRTKLQEVRNAFTREIYNSDTDPTNVFPLSDIITDLSADIEDLEPGDADKYNSLSLFDDPMTKDDSLTLYQFIEEKSHMLNQTGNAFHYALEISRRIQRISDYMNNTNSSLGINPHFNGISKFTEDVCIQGIDEGLTILSNLTTDLHLLTGDNIDNCSFGIIENDNFDVSLDKIENIYHDYVGYVADTKNETFKGGELNFDNAQLDSLGIIGVLRSANLLHYGQDDEDNSLDYVYDGDKQRESDYKDYDENFKTQTYYKNTKVARYENKYLYRNYSLTIIKVAIALTVLYIIRTINLFNFCKQQTNVQNLRSTKDVEINRLLSKKMPDNLTITDYTTIVRLKKEIEKMSTRLRSRGDSTPKYTFDLPDDTNIIPKNGEYDAETDSSLKICYKYILNLMNNQVLNKDDKLENIDSFSINTFGRLYPFTKSMLYQYDEYFSVSNPDGYNKSNNSGSFEIKFGTISNGLNYVAQSVARNKSEKYKVKNLEEMLTKIIYLCTCLTVNWSDQDEVETTSINNVTKTECPLYNLIDNFDYSENYGPYVKKEIFTDISNQKPAFKTTILGFIYGEMENVVNSDLPWVVKYVYWLSLYCINSYFIHLLKKDITKVVEKVK